MLNQSNFGYIVKTTKIIVRALCALTLAISGTASAGIIGSSADIVPIPDGFGDASGFISVLSHGAIGTLTINVAIDHTWTGDLKITLFRNMTPTRVEMMDRPGFPESKYGSSANLSSSLALSFSDAAGRPQNPWVPVAPTIKRSG